MDIRLGCVTITNFSCQGLRGTAESAPGGFIHRTLAAGFFDECKFDEDGEPINPSPAPSLARMPFIGLIAAPLGELTALAQVIAGIAGMALFALPAICLPKAREYLELSAQTAAAGAFMAIAYPAMLITGHTIGFCRCG